MSTRETRSSVIASIVALDSSWTEPAEPVELPTGTWKPDLVIGDERVCHICLTAELSETWLTRLRVAAAAGRRVAVAVERSELTVRTLGGIQDVGGEVLLIDTEDETVSVRSYPSVAHLVGLEDLRLTPEGRAELGHQLFDLALVAPTADLKGRLFEQCLCLLFSQVSWLRVLRTRSTNPTEEIDLVLANDAVGVVAGLAGSPIVLVSSKNEKDPVGKNALVQLLHNMSNRRKRCRLGFLCASRRVASTVELEEMRGSRGDDRVVVSLEGDEVRRLLSARDIDAAVEALILDAVLA